MTDLPDLRQINWDSDTCDCKVEVRQYVIGGTPARIVRSGPVPRIEPERVWCHLRRLDGSIEEIPMRVTTIEEMVNSGLRADYWAESRRRQLDQIAHTEDLVQEIWNGRAPTDRADPEWLARLTEDYPQAMDVQKLADALPAPSDLAGWQGVLASIRHGKTYADHEGYRRSPGTQLRGHLSHRCAKHHNQTSTSLQSQLARYHCGCVVRQITVGERRVDETGKLHINHLQWVDLCPLHRNKVLAA